MGDAKTSSAKKPLTSDEKRERARASRARRKAWQHEREENWKARVAVHFGFLETTYGFRFAKVDGSSVWQISALYHSPRLAVRVDLSFEFERVEVWLIRLVDGQLPEYPIFVNPDTPINYVVLDRALQAQAPQEAERLLGLKGLGDEPVERSLAFLARALRAYCDDVLRDDFAIFDVIAEQMHQYAREHPQGIRIIVPDTTPHEEAQTRVEETRKKFPQQPITLEYYSTKRQSKRRKDSKDGSGDGGQTK